MKKQLMMATCLFALSACSGDGGGNAASGDKGVSTQGGDGREMAATLQPGAYEVTTEFVGVEGKNVPPAMSQALKGQKETKRNCITPKDLEDAKGGLFNGDEQKDCSENTIKLSGGRMQGRLKCGSGNAASELEVEGAYTSQSYQADMRMSAAGATTHIKMNARRVGECSAEETKEG